MEHATKMPLEVYTHYTLTQEHISFLLELLTTKGVAVPITSARLAADTLETLQAMQTKN